MSDLPKRSLSDSDYLIGADQGPVLSLECAEIAHPKSTELFFNEYKDLM